MSKEQLPHVHIHIDNIDDLAAYNADKLPVGRAVIHIHINAKTLESNRFDTRSRRSTLASFVDAITPPDLVTSRTAEPD